MADGTRRRSFEDSIRKVEALLQRIHEIKAVNETPAIEASIQGIKAWSQEIESKPQFVENEVLESAEIDRDIEEPNQDFEFKALSESLTTAENLVLGESGVKLVDENEAKLVRVEGIATPSREMVDDTEDLQIQFESPKVILCSPRFVVAEVAFKGEDDLVDALTDPIKIGLPRMISVDILKIPVEYQMFVEVLEQGRTLSSEFCKTLERIVVAHKVFDKMSNKDLLSLSIQCENSNLELVDFDPGGMCCWTWLVGTQFIVVRKFVFDPGIASLGMKRGKSELFVEMHKCLLCADVDKSYFGTVEEESGYHLQSIGHGLSSFLYDRGRACDVQSMKQRLTFIACRYATSEKHGGGVFVFDPGIPEWISCLLESSSTIATAG